MAALYKFALWIVCCGAVLLVFQHINPVCISDSMANNQHIMGLWMLGLMCGLSLSMGFNDLLYFSGKFPWITEYNANERVTRLNEPLTGNVRRNHKLFVLYPGTLCLCAYFAWTMYLSSPSCGVA